MLSAYAAGLGTCWIGFARASSIHCRANKCSLSCRLVTIAPIIVGIEGCTATRARKDLRSAGRLTCE